MKALGLVLPLVVLLAACDNDAPSGAPDPQPTQSQTQPEITEPVVRDPLVGAWRPTDADAPQTLVLADDGELFLLGDPLRQGLNWEHGDGQLLLRYLNGQEEVTETRLTVTQEQDTLTLEDENSPYAGVYQRDNDIVMEISGQVALESGTGLPPQAVLAVTLQDTDGEPVVQRLIHLRDAPQPFRLYLDRDRLQGSGEYRLNARVIVNGSLLMTTGDYPLPLNGDATAITLTARDAGHEPASLVGRYRYHQGQGLFIPCDSDRRLTISGPMADALAQAYQQADPEPLAFIFMELDGIEEKRPGTEPGTQVDALVVNDYRSVSTPQSCQQPTAQLTNTYWKLVDVAGEAAPAPDEGQSQAHLVLGEDQSVKGDTGCNRLSGQYTLEDEILRFGDLATTRRACTGANVAPAFLSSLEHTRGFRIDGERLSLYGQDNNLLAVFVAEYL